jgi:DinB family protein
MENLAASIDRLACFPRVLQTLATGMTDADLRWKPGAEHWSVLEVFGHLADEEARDFRPRLERTLAGRAWEPIDPEGWASAHRYNEASPAEVLAAFATQRERSVAWLAGLVGVVGVGEVDWGCAHEHPVFGPIRAGDLLASWVDHDALHLRQIARRLHDLAVRDAGEFGTGYAGAW